MTAPSTPAYANLSRKQIVISVIVIMSTMLMSSMEQTIVGTAMPRIIADLGGFEHYTWVVTAYLIASTIAMITAGRLSDLYGRKPFLVGGTVIFIIGSFICGAAGSMGSLILARAVQGLGGGTLMGLAFTTVADLFPPAKRGRVMGIMSAAFGISAILGPTLGGIITDNFDWSWVFYFNVPIGLAVLALMVFGFPGLKPLNKTVSKPDYIGIILLASFISCFVLGLTYGGSQYPWNSWQVIGLFTGAAVFLGLFIRIQIRIKNPTFYLPIFKSRAFTPAAIVTFIVGIGMFISITFIPLYFQGVLGSSATTSGNFLTPMMLSNVIASATLGMLLSKMPLFRNFGVGGVFIFMIGLFLLSTVSPHTSSLLAVLYIIIAGIGLGMTMPTFSMVMQNSAPPGMVGMATSSNGLMRTLGGSVGLACAGSVLATQLAPNINKLVPDYITQALPSGFIDSIAANPHALFNAEAQQQIYNTFVIFGENQQIYFDNFMNSIREALASTIDGIFFIAACIFMLGVIIAMFMDDKPLRKQFIDSQQAIKKLNVA
ncbi:MAG: MFS transporter, partial [Chloroflexi bacterium]|nr:MFS transporter [Chloroflexota bacterium]